MIISIYLHVNQKLSTPFYEYYANVKSKFFIEEECRKLLLFYYDKIKITWPTL